MTCMRRKNFKAAAIMALSVCMILGMMLAMPVTAFADESGSGITSIEFSSSEDGTVTNQTTIESGEDPTNTPLETVNVYFDNSITNWNTVCCYYSVDKKLWDIKSQADSVNNGVYTYKIDKSAKYISFSNYMPGQPIEYVPEGEYLSTDDFEVQAEYTYKYVAAENIGGDDTKLPDADAAGTNDDTKSEDAAPDETPQTGDMDSLWMCMILLAASGTVLAGITVYNRKSVR